MKKVLVAMLAVAFLFTAAYSYDCGAKSSGNATKASAGEQTAKVETADANCQTDAKVTKVDANHCGDAKAMNAGAENCTYLKDASAKKVNAGDCCGSKAKANTSKASSASVEEKEKTTVASSKEQTDSKPVLMLGTPVSATTQQ